MGKNYENLKIWERSVDLAVNIYTLTESFPSKEIYGLTSQIRRSSVSISSNIAEGYARDSDNEFVRFLNISSGSLAELKTQLIIANKVGFLKKEQIIDIFNNIEEIGKMISGLKSTIRLNKEQLMANC